MKTTFSVTAFLVVFAVLLSGRTVAAPPGLGISPTSFPDGQYGSTYTQTIKVSGGKQPYTFSVSGNLPPGLTLSNDGVLAGTPTAAGKFSFKVTVQDNSNKGGDHGNGNGNGNQGDLSGSQDYTFIVDPVSLLVTAAAQTKVFGTPDPVFTYTVNGFVNGDNTGILTGSLSRSPGENVGSYPISKGSLTPGSNYTISYTGNSLTITKASQHITWTQSLLFGCNSTTQMQLTATASSGLPVTYSVSDANVASVSATVLTLVHPGTAIVTANQAGDANHTPAPAVTDTLVYQPASLIDEHWNDVLFFDNSSGDFVQWQWYKNGDAVPGATDPYYSESPQLNGQYYVVATNETGQKIQSCTVTITGGAAMPGGIKVQPNPVSGGGQATVTSNYSSAALQGAILQLIDLNGRVRQQETAVQPSTQLTMPSQTGIYIINLLLAGGQKASTNVLVVN